MQHPETVKVDNPAEPGGYMIINKSDMTSQHKLWKAPVPRAEQVTDSAPNDDSAAKKKAKG